jgi:hypothetical protein
MTTQMCGKRVRALEISINRESEGLLRSFWASS